MSQNLVQNLIRLNEQFTQQFFDLKIPKAYQQLKNSCLLTDFHRIFNFKSIENKNIHIEKMAKILKQITNYEQEKIITIFHSNRNTDITKFLTSLLIPDQSKRTVLEKIRKELVVSIRKNIPLKNDMVTAFFLLYSQIYTVSQVQKQIVNNDIFSDVNSLKKMLMSLKKMMGEPKENTITPKKKKDHYSIHLDIKKIMSEIALRLKGTKQGQMIKDLIQSSQNKKWLGPRLYKVIQQKNWGLESITILINSLRSTKLTKTDFKCPIDSLKIELKTILTNLRRYKKMCHKSKITKNSKQQQVQIENIKEKEQIEQEDELLKLISITNNQYFDKQSNYQFFKTINLEQQDSFLDLDQECSSSIFPIQQENFIQVSQML